MHEFTHPEGALEPVIGCRRVVGLEGALLGALATSRSRRPWARCRRRGSPRSSCRRTWSRGGSAVWPSPSKVTSTPLSSWGGEALGPLVRGGGVAGGADDEDRRGPGGGELLRGDGGLIGQTAQPRDDARRRCRRAAGTSRARPWRRPSTWSRGAVVGAVEAEDRAGRLQGLGVGAVGAALVVRVGEGEQTVALALERLGERRAQLRPERRQVERHRHAGRHEALGQLTAGRRPRAACCRPSFTSVSICAKRLLLGAAQRAAGLAEAVLDERRGHPGEALGLPLGVLLGGQARVDGAVQHHPADPPREELGVPGADERPVGPAVVGDDSSPSAARMTSMSLTVLTVSTCAMSGPVRCSHCLPEGGRVGDDLLRLGVRVRGRVGATARRRPAECRQAADRRGLADAARVPGDGVVRLPHPRPQRAGRRGGTTRPRRPRGRRG